MCTLFTISSELWDGSSGDELRKRIKDDALTNSDGFSLILCGDTNEHALSLQVMNIDSVFTLLDTLSWNRMWLHSRLGTTKTTGIEGCHGFRSYKGYLIQHNGIISNGGAKELPVDSMVISDLLKYMEIGDVVAWLHAYASYANVFFVNPDNGTWYVSRSHQGTLFTDGNGNYSSNPVVGASITIPVSQRYFAEYRESVKDVTPVWNPQDYYSHGYGSYRDWDTSASRSKYYTSAWEEEVPEDVAEATEEAIRETKENLLVESSSDKTMRNLKMQATLEGWKTIPYEVYKRITKAERIELRDFLKKLAS